MADQPQTTTNRPLPDKPTFGMVMAGREKLWEIIQGLSEPPDADDLAMTDEHAAQIYAAMVAAFRSGEGDWQPW